MPQSVRIKPSAVTHDSTDCIHSHLLYAKSKVASLKVLTVAKLELRAALLLARFYKTVCEAFNKRIEEMKLWSDSIVLG